MPTLASASLTAAERRVLERLVELLAREYGDQLQSVWLYGSRARGEPPHDESDVDVLVILRREDREAQLRAIELLNRAADADGINPVLFSVKVFDADWLAGWRAIKSFFIQDVDRDSIVLEGRA